MKKPAMAAWRLYVTRAKPGPCSTWEAHASASQQDKFMTTSSKGCEASP